MTSLKISGLRHTAISPAHFIRSVREGQLALPGIKAIYKPHWTLDYAEPDARNWVGAVMDTLRVEVEIQARQEPEDTAGHVDVEFAG